VDLSTTLKNNLSKEHCKSLTLLLTVSTHERSLESEKERHKIEPSIDSKMQSKVESHFDYGSFHVGRSNFFRGHVDTIQEAGVLSPEVRSKNLAVNPSENGFLGGNSPLALVAEKRRSSFSRFSPQVGTGVPIIGDRNIMSMRDHPVMRDNPSISIN
jgi:hypothetical protein